MGLLGSRFSCCCRKCSLYVVFPFQFLDFFPILSDQLVVLGYMQVGGVVVDCLCRGFPGFELDIWKRWMDGSEVKACLLALVVVAAGLYGIGDTQKMGLERKQLG